MSTQTQVTDIPSWQFDMVKRAWDDALAARTAQQELGIPLQDIALPPEFDGMTLGDRAAQELYGGIGSYAPYLQSAQSAFGAAGDVFGSGLGALGQSMGALQAFPGAYSTLAQAPGQLSTAQQQVGSALSGAQAGTSSAIGQLGTAGAMYNPNMVGQFMDPYIQHVIQTQAQEAQRQADIQRQGVSAQAVGQGAFGGSREALQQAELTRNLMDQQARITSGLLSQGFGQAQQASMSAFEDAMRRNLQASTTSGQLAQSMGQLGLSGAQQTMAGADLLRQLGLSQGQLAGQEADIARQAGTAMGAIGEQFGQLGSRQLQAGELSSNLLGADVQRLAGMDQFLQGRSQTLADLDFANQMRQFSLPTTQASWLSDIARGMPGAQMSTTATQTTQPGWGTNLVGMGISALGLGGGGGSFGFGS